VWTPSARACGSLGVAAPDCGLDDLGRHPGRHSELVRVLGGLPAPCSAVVKARAYAKKTDPFAYLDDVRTSPARCHRVVPIDRLRPDCAAGGCPGSW
jgi:hypothetical protein